MSNSESFLLPTVSGPIGAKVVLPGSKSLTHRALLTAALADGLSEIEGPLFCDDTRHTISALQALGAKIEVYAERIFVKGIKGSPRAAQCDLSMGESGTSLRFLVSVAALARGKTGFRGEGRLMQRPLQPLLDALQMLGAQIFWGINHTFVVIDGGKIKGGSVPVPGDVSSQFISSLLMVAPCTENGLEIQLTSPLISRPYVEMTIDVMNAFGVSIQRQKTGFAVAGGQPYKARKYGIEPDFSSAAYFWAAAALTGGHVISGGFSPNTRQGDRQFLDILKKMGCDIRLFGDSIEIRGGKLQGIDINMADIPDQVPTLAVLGLFAEGQTRISGAQHLRNKESNRLEDLAKELKKLGADITVLEDGLLINGKKPLQTAILDPHGDHRLAMSFALLGLLIPGTRLLQHHCVKKSFPDFWNLWQTLIP